MVADEKRGTVREYRNCSRLAWMVIAGMSLMAPVLTVAQDNLREAVPVHGYTGETFDTRKAPFDYLVDGSLARDEPASRKWRLQSRKLIWERRSMRGTCKF